MVCNPTAFLGDDKIMSSFGKKQPLHHQTHMDEIFENTQALIRKDLLLDDTMAIVQKAPQFVKGKDLIGAGEIEFKFMNEFIRSGDYQNLTGEIQMIKGDTKEKAKFSMNDKLGNQVIDLLGDDSAEWVGKSIKVRHAKINNFDTIELAQESI